MAIYHKTPEDVNRITPREDSIPPIMPPNPDNITGSLTNNQIIQDKGKALWQGEEMANQFAQRQLDKPVPPPGDPISDQYGAMFNQPFSLIGSKKPKDPKYNFVGVQGLEDKGKVKSDKKGNYVVNKEKLGDSRDTLRLPKNVWKNPTSGLIDDVEYREIADKVNKQK